MIDLKTAARTAGCLTLIIAMAACAKKEEAGGAAPVAAQEVNASLRAPAAPVVSQSKPGATGADKEVTAATPAQQMGSSAATYVDGERKFIRKASAKFNVKDVYVSALGIEDTVAAHGGFVVKNDITAARTNRVSHPIGDGKLLELSEVMVTGTLVVRVPSAKTQEFLRAIVGHIVFLDQRSFSAQDAQFELLRRQLDAIRNQETQSDIGQAIEGGGKLGPKAEAITARGEVKAARDTALLEKKEFEDQVAFSTIELSLYQPSKLVQTEGVDLDAAFRKAGPGFFSQLGDKLIGGWEGLLTFLLVLVGIWPVLVVGALVIAVVMRVRRARRKPLAAA